MMKRQPDGTWRNARQAVVVSPATLRARWLEAETVHLKLMGLSFDGHRRADHPRRPRPGDGDDRDARRCGLALRF